MLTCRRDVADLTPLCSIGEVRRAPRRLLGSIHDPIRPQFLTFFSNTVAERTDLGQMRSVQENNYTAHVYARSRDQLSGIIITDDEYPTRVAFSLINKLLDDFSAKIPESTWTKAAQAARVKAKGTKAEGIDFPQIKDYLAKYQDPKQADTIMKVQQELDETKIILVHRACAAVEGGAYCAVTRTRRSSRYWNEGRSWIRWSTSPMRARSPSVSS
jgi:hypothetical protein